MYSLSLDRPIMVKWWARFSLKMAILAILIILILIPGWYIEANAEICDVCPGGVEVGDASTCDDCNSRSYLASINTGYQEANAAANAFVCPPERNDWTGTTNSSWNSDFDSVCTMCGSDVNTRYYYYHLYPDHYTECLVECPSVDRDEDGLENDCDPFPDSDYCFQYQKFAEKRDGDVPFYITYKVKDEDGNWSFFSVGEDDSEDSISWLEVSPVTKTCNEWATDVCGGSSPTITPDSQTGYIQVDNDASWTTETGVDSESGTDSGKLQDIVSNTKNIADNQGEILSVLKSVKSGIDSQTSLLLNREGGTDVSGLQASLDVINDKIDQENEEEGSSTGDYGTDGLNLDTSMDSEGMPSQEVEPIGDQSWFTSFLNNNPYKTALDASGINVSGATSEMSVTLMGNEMSFDLSILQTPLQTGGVMLLAITGMICLIMIVRGW